MKSISKLNSDSSSERNFLQLKIRFNFFKIRVFYIAPTPQDLFSCAHFRRGADRNYRLVSGDSSFSFHLTTRNILTVDFAIDCIMHGKFEVHMYTLPFLVSWVVLIFFGDWFISMVPDKIARRWRMFSAILILFVIFQLVVSSVVGILFFRHIPGYITTTYVIIQIEGFVVCHLIGAIICKAGIVAPESFKRKQ